MSRLTKAQRAQAEAQVAAIRRRPAYHLSSVWLERWVAHCDDRIGDEWIDVDWVCSVMRHNWGGHVHELTMTVALHDHGWAFRSTKRGLRCNMSERVLLDLIRERVDGRRRPRALEDLSDPLPTRVEDLADVEAAGFYRYLTLAEQVELDELLGWRPL